MHDPMVVVAEIRSPWPRSSMPIGQERWRFRGCFWTVAGRGLYFPSLVTVWHHEPGGRDSGEVCGYPSGLGLLRHLPHLSVQLHPLQQFRRWALTRCAWCGGSSRFRKGWGINLRAPGGLADDDRAELPWWHGEQGLLHWQCSRVADAHRHCVCATPQLRSSSSHGYGWSWCSLCGLSRWYDEDSSAQYVYARIRQVTRRGERPSAEVSAQIDSWWRLHRAAKDLVEKERSGG